jgi:hypothetical protein
MVSVMSTKHIKRTLRNVLIVSLAFPGLLASGEPKLVDGLAVSRLQDAFQRSAVAYAIEAAAARLTSKKCQAVLDDFSAADGRTLREVLASRGVGPVEHLATLFFYDAPERACLKDWRLAMTTPGSRVVVVCGRRFERQRANDPGYSEALVIHEVLHTLGLGENPPSSEEIQARVLARCNKGLDKTSSR